MPPCQVCKTIYFHAGFGSPAEPCDCGACATKADVRDQRDAQVDAGSSDDPRDAREHVEAR